MNINNNYNSDVTIVSRTPMDEEIESLYSDPRVSSKFRSYTEEFNRELNDFEKSKDWADLIRHLTRVNKVLTKYNQFNVIPNKLLCAKRLAQCLQTALPSGVHIRTLETMENILKRIGSDRFAGELNVFSSGLFPAFINASTQVRPAILNMYETYYLPLGPRLTPCLTGLILSVLPAMEEPNNPMYKRSVSFLNKLVDLTGTTTTLDAVWQCLLLSSKVRLSALSYIQLRLRKLDQSKVGDDDDDSEQESKTVLLDLLPNPLSLSIHALVRCLTDKNNLVQRLALDILLNYFPLESLIFTETQRIVLIKATFEVLLSDNVSLTRRVWNWYFGVDSINNNKDDDVEENGNEEEIDNNIEQVFKRVNSPYKIMDDVTNQYFEYNVRPLLISAVLEVIRKENSFKEKSTALFPLKLLEILFRRKEIGQDTDIFKSFISELLLYLFENKSEEVWYSEVLDCGAYLLSLIGSEIVWECALIPIGNSLLNSSERNLDWIIRNLSLLKFLLDLVPFDDRITHTVHVPQAIATILKSLDNLCPSFYATSGSEVPQSQKQGAMHPLIHALSLVEQLFRAFDTHSQTVKIESTELEKKGELDVLIILSSCIDPLEVFLVKFIKEYISQIPETDDDISDNITDQKDISNNYNSSNNWTNEYIYTLTLLLQIMCSLNFRVLEGSNVIQNENTNVPGWIQIIIKCCSSENFNVFVSGLRSFLDIVSFFSINIGGRISTSAAEAEKFLAYSNLSVDQMKTLCNDYCTILWDSLESRNSNTHYIVVDLLLRLYDIFPDDVNALIVFSLKNETGKEKVKGFEKFFILWKLIIELGASGNPFTEGVYVMLEAINSEDPMIKLISRNWLLETFQHIGWILDPLLKELLHQKVSRIRNATTLTYKSPNFDPKHYLDLLLLLRAVIETGGSDLLSTLSDLRISSDLATRCGENSLTPSGKPSEDLKVPRSYLELILVILFRFIESEIQIDSSMVLIDENVNKGELLENLAALQTGACSLMQDTFATIKSSELAMFMALPFQEPLLNRLSDAVAHINILLQLQLLWLVLTVIRLTFGAKDAIQSISTSNPTSQPSNIRASLRILPINLESSSLAPPPIPKRKRSKTVDEKTIRVSSSVSSLIKVEDSLDLADFSIPSSDLFIPTVVGAVQTSGNTSYRVQWLYFVIQVLPFVGENLKNFSLSITRCLIKLIMENDSGLGSDLSTSLDLVNALTGILNYVFLHSAALDRLDQNDENKSKSNNLSRESTPTFLDFANTAARGLKDVALFPVKIVSDIKDVLVGEDAAPRLVYSPILNARSSLRSCFTELLHALIYLWEIGTKSSRNEKETMKNGSTNLNGILHPFSMNTHSDGNLQAAFAIRSAVLDLFGPLFGSDTQELVESILKVWASIIPEVEDLYSDNFSEISTRHQILLSMMKRTDTVLPDDVVAACVNIVIGLVKSREKNHTNARRSVRISAHDKSDLINVLNSNGFHPIDGDIQECVVFHFLGLYLQNCSTSEISAGKIWFQILSMTKIILVSQYNKVNYLGLLALFSRVIGKILPAKSSRLYGEVLEICHKIIEQVEFLAEKIDNNNGQQFLWFGKQTQAEPFDRRQGYGIFPPDLEGQITKDYIEDKKTPKEKSNSSKKGFVDGRVVLSLHALNLLYIWTPNIVNNLFRSDKEQTWIFSSFLSVVAPYLKVPKYPYLKHSIIVAKYLSYFHTNPIAVECFKKEIWDLFISPDFFFLHPSTVKYMALVVNSILKHSKDGQKMSFKDLSIIKMASPPSLFVSKEQENISRAKLWTKVAFALYAGKKNQYVKYADNLRDQIVEAFRTRNSIIHSELFFLFRVFLLRMPLDALNSLWPLIVTEMMKIFSDPKPNPSLYLSCCKFLDFVLVLAPDSFQSYDWIFLSPWASTKESLVFPPTDSFRPLITISKNDSVSSINKFMTELPSWLRQNQINGSPVDYEFIESIIEQDFYKADYLGNVFEQNL